MNGIFVAVMARELDVGVERELAMSSTTSASGTKAANRAVKVPIARSSFHECHRIGTDNDHPARSAVSRPTRRAPDTYPAKLTSATPPR
jgi:hypothetical protein